MHLEQSSHSLCFKRVFSFYLLESAMDKIPHEEKKSSFQNTCNKQLLLFVYAVFRPIQFLITCQWVMFVSDSSQHQSLMVVHHRPIWGWINKQSGLCSSFRIYKLVASALVETAAEVWIDRRSRASVLWTLFGVVIVPENSISFRCCSL